MTEPHVVVAVQPTYQEDGEYRVLHMCIYPDKPNEQDFLNLSEELEKDGEFKLTEPFVLIEAPDSVKEEMKSAIDYAWEEIKKTLQND